MHRHMESRPIPYTGAELRSHWIMEAFDLRGDAVVAFVGACDVEIEHMVDLVDVADRACIRSAQMLHLIVEHFGLPLCEAVLRQRLLVVQACEVLRSVAGMEALRRHGDDLFLDGRKLSVSIATVSPVSALIHLGINVDPTGAPVSAVGLAEFGVEPADFARRLMSVYATELAEVREACCKVRPVP
jgi:uncharacterized protein